jgi:hypothetical protein
LIQGIWGVGKLKLWEIERERERERLGTWGWSLSSRVKLRACTWDVGATGLKAMAVKTVVKGWKMMRVGFGFGFLQIHVVLESSFF